MNYISTRGYERKYKASEAIIQGIAPDGGLFVPDPRNDEHAVLSDLSQGLIHVPHGFYRS